MGRSRRTRDHFGFYASNCIDVKSFLVFLVAGLLVILSSVASAQSYIAQPGDTAIQVNVEGRGTIVVRLFPDKAPRTVEHILSLVRQGFYDGTRFHEVQRTPRPYIARFGDPQTRTQPVDSQGIGTGGSGKTVPLEKTGLPHIKGALALARPADNPNGGDAQMYFVLGPARFLDDSYTVFGQVVQGMNVLDAVQRGDRITSIRVLSGG